MTYQLSACGVMRVEDRAFIPQDPTNRDWLEYQQWLLTGGQVLPDETLEKVDPNSTLTTLAKKWLGAVARQP